MHGPANVKSMLENNHVYAPNHSLIPQKFKKIPFETQEYIDSVEITNKMQRCSFI